MNTSFLRRMLPWSILIIVLAVLATSFSHQPEQYKVEALSAVLTGLVTILSNGFKLATLLASIVLIVSLVAVVPLTVREVLERLDIAIYKRSPNNEDPDLALYEFGGTLSGRLAIAVAIMFAIALLQHLMLKVALQNEIFSYAVLAFEKRTETPWITQRVILTLTSFGAFCFAQPFTENTVPYMGRSLGQIMAKDE